MAAGAALSLVAILWLSRSVGRRSPATITPLLFAVSAIGLLGAWGIGRVSPRVGAVAVYLHLALFGPAVLTTFWSLINERFEPHAAKRAVARIAGGGTLGGVLGSLAAWRASSVIEVPTLLLFLAGMHAVCAVGSFLVRAHDTPPSHAPREEPRSPFAELQAAPFLRNIALLVALGAAMSALLDYIFSARAAAAFPDGQALLSFFSLFWLAVTALSFLFQIALGRLALEKLGLALSMTVLPGVVAVGATLGLVMPGLTTSAILRGAEAVQRNTMFRSAYELLYTPLLEARKRATKALIDIGFDRIGTVLGSAILLLALHLLPAQAESIALILVVTIALATIPVTKRLHLGYVAALEEGLSAGAEKLELRRVADPALDAVESRQRDELIERVERLGDVIRDGAASARLEKRAAIISRGSDLFSGNVERARRALESWDSEHGVLASLAVLLLADRELHLDALRVLRRVAGEVTGQLVDALVDPATELVVRRRIPRALAVCSTERAAGGLILGLRDPRFEVRYECARALLRITTASAHISIPRAHVVAAVLREIEPEKNGVELELDEEIGDEHGPVGDLLLEDRTDRRLQHIFTILSLYLEREPLGMALRALHHDDVRHRGTALEYLHTVLPGEIRDALWPLLGESGALPVPRPAAEVLMDLTVAVGPRERTLK
jgi:hypothetical protein